MLVKLTPDLQHSPSLCNKLSRILDNKTISRNPHLTNKQNPELLFLLIKIWTHLVPFSISYLASHKS